MALTEEQKNALARGGQYAGYGAAIGAPIGGPLGAGIGAGVGFAGGLATEALLGAGQSEYEKFRQQEIEELKRRQELGLLGLTDEERAVLTGQLIDPIRSQQRQSQLQLMGGLTGQGAGPADLARFQIGQEQRIAEQVQPALTEVARADLAKQRLEEEQLRSMLREQDAQQRAEEQARQKQITQGLTIAGLSVGKFAAAEGEAAARANEYEALLNIIGGGGATLSKEDAAGADALYQSIYGEAIIPK